MATPYGSILRDGDEEAREVKKLRKDEAGSQTPARVVSSVLFWLWPQRVVLGVCTVQGQENSETGTKPDWVCLPECASAPRSVLL